MLGKLVFVAERAVPAAATAAQLRSKFPTWSPETVCRRRTLPLPLTPTLIITLTPTLTLTLTLNHHPNPSPSPTPHPDQVATLQPDPKP